MEIQADALKLSLMSTYTGQGNQEGMNLIHPYQVN